MCTETLSRAILSSRSRGSLSRWRRRWWWLAFRICKRFVVADKFGSIFFWSSFVRLLGRSCDAVHLNSHTQTHSMGEGARAYTHRLHWITFPAFGMYILSYLQNNNQAFFFLTVFCRWRCCWFFCRYCCCSSALDVAAIVVVYFSFFLSFTLVVAVVCSEFRYQFGLFRLLNLICRVLLFRL